jgi:hypothetical protein
VVGDINAQLVYERISIRRRHFSEIRRLPDCLFSLLKKKRVLFCFKY